MAAEFSNYYNVLNILCVDDNGKTIASNSLTVSAEYDGESVAITYNSSSVNGFVLSITPSVSVEVSVTISKTGYITRFLKMWTDDSTNASSANRIKVVLHTNDIAGELARIEEAKADIRTAITNKNGFDPGTDILQYGKEIYDDKRTGKFIVQWNNDYEMARVIEVSSDNTNWEEILESSDNYYDKIPSNTRYIKITGIGTTGKHNLYCGCYKVRSVPSGSVANLNYTTIVKYQDIATTSTDMGNLGEQIIVIPSAYTIDDIDIITFSFACLIKGTLIMLFDGTQKPIEDITFDDELLVWDFYNGKFTSAKPLFIKKAQVAREYNLCTFSNGTKVGFVGEGGDKGYHRIFNKERGAFTYTGNEKETPIGTTTFSLGKESFPSLTKQEIAQGEPTLYYNVITDKHYNLFANGILTSMHWNNRYDINTETMRYDLSNENISQDTIDKAINEMKNNIIWKSCK